MKTRKRSWRLAGAALAGAVACVTVLFATAPPGPGLDPDAMSYLGSGESLVTRGSLRIPVSNWSVADTTEPLVHFPPGFPVAIAVPVAMGLPAIQAGRLVVCVSAFATAALVYLLVEAAAGAVAGAVAVVAVFSTPAVLGVYLSIVSEPLFNALLLAALVAMVSLRRQWTDDAPSWRTVPTLLVLGAIAAAAMLVRYAGASVVGAAALWPLLASTLSWRRRVASSVLAVAPATVAGLAWVNRIAHVGGSSGVRVFRLYHGVWRAAGAGARTLRDALVPGSGGEAWRSVVAVAATLALTLALWRVVRALQRSAPAPGRPAIALALLGAVGVNSTTFIALVLMARAIADPEIPFDGRILAPCILLLEIAVIVVLAHVRPHARGRGWGWGWGWGWPRLGAAAVGLVFGAWLVASIGESAAWVRDGLDDGLDLAETRWRTSATLDWVRAHGASYTVYTNWPAAVYFHVHRAVHDLPPTLDALTIRRFRDRMVRHHGVVVALDVPNREMASPDSIAARVPLRAIARLPDGTIWGP